VDNFSVLLGVDISIYDEFIGNIYALEHAWNESFHKLWLGSDYSLVCHVFWIYE